MSLIDAMKELNKSGWDAKKGKDYNPNAGIPDGTYTVELDNVTHNAKNDREFLMITFQVVEGEHEGQTETVFPSLAQTTATGKPMPDGVIARSIAQIKLIGEAVGIDVPDKCFLHDSESEAYEDIVKVFHPALGRILKLNKETRPNRKNPQYPYRNYKFAKNAQPKQAPAEDPFKDDDKGSVEIDDSQMPF